VGSSKKNVFDWPTKEYYEQPLYTGTSPEKVTKWRIRLENDTVRITVRFQVFLWKAWVHLDLVNKWCHPTVRKELFESFDREVRHAQSLDLS
jgi:hypothetical protein